MSKGHRTKVKRERNAERDTRPKAIARFMRIPSTKAKLVLDQIKGKDVETAKALLIYSPRYAAVVIGKLLNSAIANAENNLGMDAEKLYVEEAFANQGPTLKRFQPRSHGRADRIEKKTSHISIILNER